MSSNDGSSALQESNDRRSTLSSHLNRLEGGGGSDIEAAAGDLDQNACRRSSTLRFESSFASITESVSTSSALTEPAPVEPTTFSYPDTAYHASSSSRGPGPRSSLLTCGFQPNRGRYSAIGSPSHGNHSTAGGKLEVDGASNITPYELDLSLALEDDLLEDNLIHNNAKSSLRRLRTRPHYPSAHTETSTPHDSYSNVDLPTYDLDDFGSYTSNHTSSPNTLEHLRAASRDPSVQEFHVMGESMNRTRDKFENDNGKDLLNNLRRQGAVTAMLCHSAVSDPKANDIWPYFRSAAKLPARYTVLEVSRNTREANEYSEWPQKVPQNRYDLRGHVNVSGAQPGSQSNSTRADSAVYYSSCTIETPDESSRGRPLWQLPVELVEQIIEHLDRDDIKSLRLVSRELNDYTSQAAFKTVVVPFNTEIYGMLGQELKPDRKGKTRAKISRIEYWWKNANGDEVYNGHGLDVFRGFGRHILRYGMSFEVNEDSLSAPPLKSVTEQKTSFWGNYEWPFEEYRRFDAVAGLESAADETPRMKTAFSELTKVRELALSVDSGLGWLNGPDRSIRARVLQRQPSIFGSRHSIPDRRTQAQHELWNHIETTHAHVGEDVRTASLYRLEGVHSLAKAQEASLLASFQPRLPFIDSHILHEATPHDATDSVLSQPSEDFDLLNRHILGSPPTNTDVLFTSTKLQHSDAAQAMSPIVPATLSKAQKEWLLETEWAQRAFMSSYMLSIIDNPATFHPIHTLNISSLADRYIPTLNRADFWSALPNLKKVTLMVIPSWRTVQKDGVGFVDTPTVDPTDRIDTFCELLRTQVALRPKITNLTIGFTTGGEHAEGLHARNKLLMPAPLLPLRVCKHEDPTLPPAETATLQDANILRQALLRFPYLEELTLRNCWITPSALEQFVKLHDECSLKHLTLESVSLTAVLRPIRNAQAAQAGQHAVPQNDIAAQHMIGALWHFTNNNIGGNAVPAHHLPANNQLLNLFIQSLIFQLQQMQANAGGLQQQHNITALQTQLQLQLQLQLQTAQVPNLQQFQDPTLPLAHNPVQQNPHAQQQQSFTQMAHLNHLVTQVNLMQQLIAGQGAPIAASTNTPIGNAYSILQMQPRQGSWMDIIDQISPGTNLADFESPHSQAEPTRITSLSSISFISCGYAKLPHLIPGVDQSAIEAVNGFAAALRNPVFTKRYNALSSVMLNSKWPYLGEIVQEVDLSELAALDAGWSLKHGWEDFEAARAVEFDGLLSGGTGRFTGKIQRSDRVDTEAGSASAEVLTKVVANMLLAH